MNWIDKEVAFYDFVWAYGVGAHTNCINRELYEDFAAGGDKFEEMKKLILQKFPTREVALKEFEAEQNIPAKDQHGRKLAELGVQYGRELDKVKPLAQYLAEHIKCQHSTNIIFWNPEDLVKDMQQTLDAYESTEQVKIRIEPV